MNSNSVKVETIKLRSNLYIYIIIYNETYHVNKGVIVSIRNTASIVTLALPKSDNNNNNNNNNNNILSKHAINFSITMFG